MLTLLLGLIVLGVLLWLVNQYVPMAQPIKTIVNVVIVVVALVWTLRWFGVLGAW